MPSSQSPSWGHLYPYGFRRVAEEHPFVWLYTDALSDVEKERFHHALHTRLGQLPGGWFNEECDPDQPVGCYITAYGDLERSQLASDAPALTEFIKAELEPILAMSDDFDAALRAARA